MTYLKEVRTLGISPLGTPPDLYYIVGYSLSYPPSSFTWISPYFLGLSVDTTSSRKFHATSEIREGL